MIKFAMSILCVLLPISAAAQTPTPPPRPEPAPKRRPSMVGYINDSTIRSQLRVRFDAGYGLNSADRAEFFYAKYGWYAHQPTTFVNYDPDAPGPWPGLLADGNFSQLYLLGEYGFANSRASAFVELPVRWFRPGEWIPGFGVGEKSTGLSDIRFGAKLGLMSNEGTQATILFQVTTPTGDAAKALGTNHASIEPAFLLAQSVGDKVNVEGQFGMVIPAGYSFNLDGTSIYLSMASIFIAQVYGIDLSIGQQLSLLAVLMLTSKGAAGVTGSGFIVLASTLAAMRVVPVEGLAIVLGVDRFMSEARAIVNLIGNGVATLVISRIEGAFDETQRAAAVEEMKAGQAT